MQPYDCAIVGAGIHGLCTAFWSVLTGSERVLVLDRHGPGHEFGSSHGETRITRSSYADPEFVAMAARAHAEAWPRLERELGRPLRVPAPGVFFGPADGPLADYLVAARTASGLVVPIPAAAARQRFPLLAIADDDAVLVDQSAAVVLAAETMAALRQWLAAHGVELRWHTPVHAVEPHPQGLTLLTGGERIVAHRAVLACGPWTGRLHAAATPVCVLRQEVGYVDLDAPAAACQAGAFPVWARIGRTADEFTYGLPALGDRGVKIAAHRTAGTGVDPDAPPPPLDTDALLALARRHFTVAVHRLRATERCLYTMTADQRFRVAPAADLPLVHVVACSGHAFKFGPLIGRTAAEMAASLR